MTHDDRLFLCCQVHGKVHGSRRQSKYTNIGRHLTKNAMISRMSKFVTFSGERDGEDLFWQSFRLGEEREGWMGICDGSVR